MLRRIAATCMVSVVLAVGGVAPALAGGEVPPGSAPTDSTPTVVPEIPPWAVGVSDEDQEAARVLDDEAATLFASENYQGAVDTWARALKHWNHPVVHFNRMVALLRLKRFVDARVHLDAAMAHDGLALTPDQRSQIDNYRGILDSAVVTFVVETTQEGVEITLNGEVLLSAPGRAERVILPGRHALNAQRPGFEPLTKTLTLIGGEAYTETIVLAPRKREVQLVRRWPVRTPWVVAAAGGGAMLVGGIAIAVGASRISDWTDYVDKNCAKMACVEKDLPEDIRQTRWTGRLLQGIGGATLGLGAAAAITGAVMIALNQPKEREVQPQVQPVVGGGAVVGLSGRF